jgi:hypothetical protein
MPGSTPEAVTAAVVAALGTVPGVATVERMRVDTVPDDLLPALLVYEDNTTQGDAPARLPPGGAPLVMVTEALDVVGMVSRPTAAEAATALNALLDKAWSALLADQALRGLAGANGGITVESVERQFDPDGDGCTAAFGLRLMVSHPYQPGA